MIIHDTPKRSATMPKRSAKNVSLSGICTWPPSARAANRFSASAAVAALIDSENPLKLGFPAQLPSDAITCASPIRNDACMISSRTA